VVEIAIPNDSNNSNAKQYIRKALKFPLIFHQKRLVSLTAISPSSLIKPISTSHQFSIEPSGHRCSRSLLSFISIIRLLNLLIYPIVKLKSYYNQKTSCALAPDVRNN
jgi:hypothetical protein